MLTPTAHRFPVRSIPLAISGRFVRQSHPKYRLGVQMANEFPGQLSVAALNVEKSLDMETPQIENS